VAIKLVFPARRYWFVKIEQFVNKETMRVYAASKSVLKIPVIRARFRKYPSENQKMLILCKKITRLKRKVILSLIA
jgi:hypothetical protein